MRVWGLLAVSCVLPVALPLAQTTTFSSRVEAVRVDVLVTDRAKPVRGLGIGDFELFDNGVKQQLDLVSLERLPLNVVLTLDMSGSVVGDRLVNLRGASLGLLDALVPGDRAALVTFNQNVLLGANLTGDWPSLRTAIRTAEPIGETSLVDASFTGMMLGEADVGRALVIVFSDGLDTKSWLTPNAVIDVAKRCNVVVYAVSAAGGGRKPRFLEGLSEQTGGRLLQVDSATNLREVFLKVLDEFRQRYLVSYSPRGVATEGWHQLTVRTKARHYTVKARPGYFVGR